MTEGVKMLVVFYASCLVGVALVVIGYRLSTFLGYFVDKRIERYEAKKAAKSRAKWEIKHPNWREEEAEKERLVLETSQKAYDALVFLAGK
jgi:hypothetical protein